MSVSGPNPTSPGLTPSDETAVQNILGYLNFGSGKPEPKFHGCLNQLHRLLGTGCWKDLSEILRQAVDRYRGTSSVFSNVDQARQVIDLVFNHVAPAYRKYHADLFFHLKDQDFELPYFLGRLCEATLAQGGPWEESDRIVQGALRQLNDFIGHRPVAILENGQLMQPYAHERFRPIPLYLAGVGVSVGPFEELLEGVLKHLRETPASVLEEAHFHLENLDELALDPRAYDHQHPVYKRTNYMFGEWDPHQIDNKGHYRRFVLRSVVMGALLDWMKTMDKVPHEEVVFEASAVLCGTMLMASTISGEGPNTYDSTVSLGTLLSKVARQRDAFYARLLDTVKGKHAERLKKESHQAKQPFGKVRQHLNLFVANNGSKQVQHGHLSYLFARMGFPEAARQQAIMIPANSARFECEIEWRLTSAHLHLDRNEVTEAAAFLPQIEDWLHRGINCGALADPWNILGFQGNFPLFHAREDSVLDPRIEKLLYLIDQIVVVNARVMSEAAADGQRILREKLVYNYQKFVEWWDMFASSTVSGLPEVKGQESFDSASQVADALAEWHAAGEGAGDISFWRQHVHKFESAKAYALVLDVLLSKQDTVAAMALLIQWLSNADQVGLESGSYSFHNLIFRWLRLVLRIDPKNMTVGTEPDQAAENLQRFEKAWPIIVRLFDYMEANAGDYWSVPSLDIVLPRVQRAETDRSENEEDDDDDDLFNAAYENVVFRDSAKDGQEGPIMDQGRSTFDTDLDMLLQRLDSRLKFQVTLSRLWQIASATYATVKIQVAMTGHKDEAQTILAPAQVDTLRGWYDRSQVLQAELLKLMNEVWKLELPKPSGDHDSLVEYDRQLQLKFNVMSGIIFTHVGCHEATWHLASCLPEQIAVEGLAEWEPITVSIYRSILGGQAAEVREQLPQLIQKLSNIPLLYVPLDQGGDPERILRTRTVQTVIRSLLDHLPRLGLLRESWQLLKTAQKMERYSPPSGTVITEFDRLFHSAFNAALEGLLQHAKHWTEDYLADSQLVEVVSGITEFYHDLWMEHSDTMRLSTLEAMDNSSNWKEVKEFIKKYGAEFFHAQMLTFGNLRAILHNGVAEFLEYLAQNDDPLRPNKLLADLDKNIITIDEAVYYLEIIFRSTVEKYDRFLEYNTTTTQSDYGEQYYCLLDFLRLEARYERFAWDHSPLVAAHEVLIRTGLKKEARIWRDQFVVLTNTVAREILHDLKKLERQYGVRLPGITDLFNERFVKPLALDELLALVPEAMNDARERRVPSENFNKLVELVREYLNSTTGSGLEIPPWLRDLEDEIAANDHHGDPPEDKNDFRLTVPLVPMPPEELERQVEIWETPLRRPSKRKKK